VTDTTRRRLRQLASIGVAELHNVGDARAEALGALEIFTVFDLLTTYPRRYVDRTKRVDLSDLTIGEEVAIFATVDRISARRTRQGRALTEATVSHEGESLKVVFFNQAWRAKQLPAGTQALFFGKVTEYRGQRQMTNPVVDVLVGVSGVERDASRVGRVVAIYPASGKAGLTSWEIGGFVEESLERAGTFVDPVPASILARLDLVDRTSAFRGIHLPGEVADTPAARRRLAFDELLRLQLLLVLRRRRLEATSAGIAHPARLGDLRPAARELTTDSLVARFLSGHHFTLTGAQSRVLDEIFVDLASARPMHRLLQGDVGSGKTVVALAALLAVIDGHRQGAVMAPTEVLAEQHLSGLRSDLAGLTRSDEAVLGGRRPVNVQLLTGRLRAKERATVLAGLASGAVDIVVGTHALLTNDVRFASLGLVVIDEQHRFGVEQRATLRDKGRAHSSEGADPDLLVMTATPIPRTAAMVIFGDLDLSTLDEMPAGREPVTTTWLRDAADVETAWERVRDEVAGGRRAFVVCPLVEGSDRVQATSAVEERDRLASGPLSGLRVGLLHGQMKGADKDEVMDQFRAGELDVLVATVVIEVGVDVPEATVMVVEDAWRFGLAQLHQLRGRVGRGGGASYCYLLGEPPSPDGETRLAALVATNDGFELAEIDLDLRGEGTLLGARQRGRSDLRLARLRTDGDLLAAARDAANEMASDDDRLATHGEIVDELRLFVDDDEADFLFKS
jgi:ATP-dependent DNA helicase RecG